MILKGQNQSCVSFPVGGIGAGCIGIDGYGHLTDWEIFNEAGKNRRNGISHFAVRAEKNKKVLDARILQGQWLKNYTGEWKGSDVLFSGFGWGVEGDTLCGFPCFRDCEMEGAFPIAEYRFSDKNFPGKTNLTAWSPFIPGESDLASMPCAMYEIEIKNTGKETLDYSCIAVLTKPWDGVNTSNHFEREKKLSRLILKNNEPEDSLQYGELALTTDAEDVSFQEYLFRGSWSDYREVYNHDLLTPGHFKNRFYDHGFANDSGGLAAHFRLRPGETKRVHFIISWYLPNRSNTWTNPQQIEKLLNESKLKKNFWKNYYAKLCTSAVNAAEIIFKDYETIRQDVFTFSKALHESTIPEAALNGAAENLSVLISPTCLRVEDGTFWGWEGVGVKKGSCPGTCQHVWNYAQALSLLFPDLERSIRESMLKYNVDPDGGFHFRLELPLGIRARKDWFRPCVDGTFGEIMKMFREWKISGDTKWLRKWYPVLKKIMKFTWSKKNIDRWDPQKSGMLTGRQHHTLDMELLGPSGWLESHYLGGLKAMSCMASACGDPQFAGECDSLFRKGKKKTEKELFNGEYYIQKIDLSDRALLEKFTEKDSPDFLKYWDQEHSEIKYQIGDGCEIDSHLGQWYASMYGIGELLDPKQILSNLNSICKYNFRKNMSQFTNTWRIYSLNREAGTVICTWPEKTRKPVIPLPYNSETMTGFEWAVACHCVMAGVLKEGSAMAKAIRDRFNGIHRNPWNEFECGSNYARSMAAYGMLQAYSGFQYDMTRGMIGFSPKISGNFRCFWSLGIVWGTYEKTAGKQIIRILHGEAAFSEFFLKAKSVKLNGRKMKSAVKNGKTECRIKVRKNDTILFE